MGGLRDSLKQAVRQMAFRTSLDDLKKKGVQQVNVLGIDRIIQLIDEAVHRSLKSRLVGLDREAVADATKAEFLRLLRSKQDLEREKTELERLKERAEDEVDTLRRELEQQQRALQLRLEQDDLDLQARYAGEDAAIAGKVAEVLRAMAGSGGSLRLQTLQESVLALVMDVVADERKSAEVARAALRDREVDTLQRRIRKLNESLVQTEQRYKEVAAMKNIDDGISSVYREVQGLRGDEAQVARKKELMAEIFKANLRLQKSGPQSGARNERIGSEAR